MKDYYNIHWIWKDINFLKKKKKKKGESILLRSELKIQQYFKKHT